MKSKLSPDILDKIVEDFEAPDREQVIAIMEDIKQRNFNVGTDQIIRSLIFLAKGSTKTLFNTFLPMMKLDPRDIIMEAEEEAGNPGHWFSIPFNKMNDLR